jgi:hypothetical protein
MDQGDLFYVQVALEALVQILEAANLVVVEDLMAVDH